MKFSIITPVFNMEEHISETIKSVLSQKGDFEIEYIVIDGCSQDSTLDIVKSFELQILDKKMPLLCKGISMRHISEKDTGMYDALNKGFATASGDVVAWINADDTYLDGAFQTIYRAFKSFPEIEWLKGKTVFVDSNSKRTSVSPCYIFNKKWIQNGIYGRNAYFINQDSVFWRMSLMQKIGLINTENKLAGDYELWIKLSQYAELWSVNAEVSTFRKRDGQLSNNENSYRKEQFKIKPKNKYHFFIKLFFRLKSLFGKKGEFIFFYLYPLLFWRRKKEYIKIENNDPKLEKVFSYRV